jgi:hypothetical protein
MTPFTLYLKNESTRPEVKDAMPWILAGLQASSDAFAKDWRPFVVRDMATVQDPSPDLVVGRIVDAASDPDAVAYHTESAAGVAQLEFSMDQVDAEGHSVLDGLLPAIDHECKEWVGNPHVNLWADGWDGYERPRELCDAVQNSLIQVTLTLPGKTETKPAALSNYVKEAWFDPQGKQGDGIHFDAAGTIDAPFELKSGYTIVRPTAPSEQADWGWARDVARGIFNHHDVEPAYRPSNATGRLHFLVFSRDLDHRVKNRIRGRVQRRFGLRLARIA